MNVMITEIHENMWMEKCIWGQENHILPNASNNNLIKLLDDYYLFYIDKDDQDNKLYVESIEEKINEYRWICNGEPYQKDWFLP
jgi:hypothetical protein